MGVVKKARLLPVKQLSYDRVEYDVIFIDASGVVVELGDVEGGEITVTWEAVSDKPAVLAAGETQEAAREAIGAGTSNLTLGTTAGTAKAGNYAPTWGEVSNKPAVIAAGVDAATARQAIGAGTSNLQLGTNGSSAKPGDYVPTWAEVSEKPAAVAAGPDAASARQAIGAGTSNLELGTTASTAAAGNHTHSDLVPTSRTVNGQPLSADISVDGSDVTLTGFTQSGDPSGVTEADSVNSAIAKLEARIAQLEAVAP